ncbi:uncharacterized protein V6R79_018360 [Siganus canaliculatus]
MSEKLSRSHQSVKGKLSLILNGNLKNFRQSHQKALFVSSLILAQMLTVVCMQPLAVVNITKDSNVYFPISPYRSSTVNTKMALKNLISTKVDITTFVPTPLRVAVLKIAETPRVISWTFDDFSVKPAVIKKNKTVVITDGQSLAKITLYESSGSCLEEGGSYVMRGHSLRGRGPPYFINVARNTMFFRGPAIKFSEELMADAEKQVNPSSSVVHLEKYTTASSLVTVHINIIEDLKVTTVCLWREADTFSLNVGEAVSITHLKPKSADHGWFLQSTAFTKKTKKVLKEVTIIGVTEGKDAGTMQVLVADGQVFIVSATLWEPFEQFLQTDIITVNLVVDGKAIQSISTINLEE